MSFLKDPKKIFFIPFFWVLSIFLFQRFKDIDSAIDIQLHDVYIVILRSQLLLGLTIIL